jgi:hypothetical protein
VISWRQCTVMAAHHISNRPFFTVTMAAYDLVQSRSLALPPLNG